VTTWRRAPGVVWRRSGDRRILLGPSSEEPVILAGSGGVIWDLLEGPAGESDLCAQLEALHDEPAAAVEPATTAFLQALHDAGMVEAR
jgi:hypothetical protein